MTLNLSPTKSEQKIGGFILESVSRTTEEPNPRLLALFTEELVKFADLGLHIEPLNGQVFSKTTSCVVNGESPEEGVSVYTKQTSFGTAEVQTVLWNHSDGLALELLVLVVPPRVDPQILMKVGAVLNNLVQRVLAEKLVQSFDVTVRLVSPEHVFIEGGTLPLEPLYDRYNLFDE